MGNTTTLSQQLSPLVAVLLILGVGGLWALLFQITKNSPWTFITPLALLSGAVYSITKNAWIWPVLLISLGISIAIYRDMKTIVRTDLKGVGPDGWLVMCFVITYCLPVLMSAIFPWLGPKWNSRALPLLFLGSCIFFLGYYFYGRNKARKMLL